MLRYAKLYSSFIRICIMREMEARGSFFVGSLVIISFPIFPLLLIGAMYEQTATLGGWTIYQYFVLSGTFQIIAGFVMALFMKNIFGMPEYVRKGELDFFLLKPVNSQFMLTTRYLSFNELAQIIPGIVLLCIGLANQPFAIEWWRWPIYLLFMVCGVFIAYSIWFISVLPCIWWVRLESQEMFFSFFEMGRYHPSMFGGILKTALIYLLPVGVIAATPADLLLNRLTWDVAIWTVFVAVGLLFLSSRLWRFAQTRYYGASS